MDINSIVNNVRYGRKIIRRKTISVFDTSAQTSVVTLESEILVKS